jgi:cysteine desulfurase
MPSPSHIYFDNNASQPLWQKAREAMLSALDNTGNPSSIHHEGRAARKIIEQARADVAALAGAAPSDVVFTSGGTEANNLAMNATAPLGCTSLIISAIEHPSVSAAAHATGLPVHELPVTAGGAVSPETLAEVLATTPGPALVAIMLANNETGVIQPVAELARLTHAAGGFLHCDAVQAAAHMPPDMALLGADMLSLSAHKLGGPQGAGALVLACGMEIKAQIMGGGQEQGRRGGTENTAGIAGFGAAASLAVGTISKSRGLEILRDRLESRLKAMVPGVIIAGDTERRLPNTTLAILPGFRAETVIIALDLDGIAVSAGSACSSGKVGVSPVLTAMGFDDTTARSAIRISLGRQNTERETSIFIDTLSDIVQRMDKIRNMQAA